jgi:hypothetical protein
MFSGEVAHADKMTASAATERPRENINISNVLYLNLRGIMLARLAGIVASARLRDVKLFGPIANYRTWNIAAFLVRPCPARTIAIGAD